MSWLNKKKTEQQLRNEQNELEESKQFPIKFKDGTTIYQQPDKMESVHGFPVLNTKKYLKNHHPDRVDEYEQHLSEFQKRVSSW